MKVAKLFFYNLETTRTLCENLPYGVAVVLSSTRLAYRYGLVATCLIVASSGCTVSNVCLQARGYGIQARLDCHACSDVCLFSDRDFVMSNVQTLVGLRAQLATVAGDDKAAIELQIEKLEKSFAHDESFVPKGWREVIGQVDPLPLKKAGEVGPIDDTTIKQLEKAGIADKVVHAEFAKGTTLKTFMERLKGKTFFTLPELAVACGFDNEERNLNQIVGSAEFRAVMVSFAKKGRIIKAKKGPGQGATSVENVKELAATLDL